MDVPDYEKKWDKHFKELKGQVPVHKDLLSEIGGVQGALGQLKTVKADADKLCDELKKALIKMTTSATSLTKELSGVDGAAKKAGTTVPVKAETEKDVKLLLKNVAALRDALTKFESATD